MRITSVYSLLLGVYIMCIALLRVSSTLDIVEIISKMNDQGNTTELSERVYRKLDSIEDLCLKSWHRTKYQRSIVQTLMVIILYYFMNYI